MICCCPKDKATSYVVEESGEKQGGAVNAAAPNNTTGGASIQTGKGALSSSTQNIPAEAQLDKSTISATKKEKSPVTEQPTSALLQAATQKAAVVVEETVKSQTQSASNAKPPQQPEEPVKSESQQNSFSDKLESAKSVAFSQIEDQVVKNQSVITHAKSAVSSNLSDLKSKAENIDLLKPIVSGIDKLESSIGEAEERPAKEAKQAVPALAAQLKGLNSQVLSAAKGPAKMSDNLQKVVSRLEAVASRLESLAVSGGKGAAAGDADAVAPSVTSYDSDVIGGALAKFLSLSNDIGGDIKTQAAMVKGAFDAQRSFLVVASKSKQPAASVLPELLKPMGSKLNEIQEFRENNRRSDFFNHLSAISESISALAWVTISPTPGPYVKELTDAGTFYTNRVLKDFKEKDPRHVEWTKAWISTLSQLQAYIKEFHTTGTTWNPNGGDAKAAQAGAGAGAPPPPPAGGAPPPPPPPGPPPPPPPVSSGADDSAGRSALFSEINKGEAVTSGLRKVTDDMKTHKNPALRRGPAPFKAGSPKPATSPKPGVKAAPAKPPLTELQGKKWVVEYHKDNKNIIIDQTELKQSLYAFRCEGCTIQVKGKINSIILDSCKKTAVVFDGLVSSLEFVNCQSMQAQVVGKVPTVSIDKTDGCQVYLSADTLDTEIVSAKSSEMNVLVPQGEGDFKEFALPEQYKTVYDGKQMVTTATDIA